MISKTTWTWTCSNGHTFEDSSEWGNKCPVCHKRAEANTHKKQVWFLADDIKKDYVSKKELEVWINNMLCGGTMLIARTPELKAQKKGEMMMLHKIKERFFHSPEKEEFVGAKEVENQIISEEQRDVASFVPSKKNDKDDVEVKR